MLKSFYHLARNPYFDWYASMTEMLVGDSIVNVDYFDEEKFAEAAGKLAKTALDTIDLTARKAWKDADGVVEKTVAPLNKLCNTHEIKMQDKDAKTICVFVKSETEDELSGRFVTTYMGDYFRPLDYSLIRSRGGWERAQQVVEKLE